MATVAAAEGGQVNEVINALFQHFAHELCQKKGEHYGLIALVEET
jgi:hypothetical protein